MKTKLSLYVYVCAAMTCGMISSSVIADSDDIMKQFRAPYSLNEILHDGFIYVQDLLEQISSMCQKNSSELLQIITSKLEDLQSLYTHMYAKSSLHEIRRDERHFLETLIDRIDAMIHQLEHDETASVEEKELIRKNLNILQDFKTQLMV